MVLLQKWPWVFLFDHVLTPGPSVSTKTVLGIRPYSDSGPCPSPSTKMVWVFLFRHVQTPVHPFPQKRFWVFHLNFLAPGPYVSTKTVLGIRIHIELTSSPSENGLEYSICISDSWSIFFRVSCFFH